MWSSEHPDETQRALGCTSAISSRFLEVLLRLALNMSLYFHCSYRIRMAEGSQLANTILGQKAGVYVARSVRLGRPGGIQTHESLDRTRKVIKGDCLMHSQATGRFCTRCGAILDIQTAVRIQNEIESLDRKFSTLLQDEDVQKLLMKKMIEHGIK